MIGLIGLFVCLFVCLLACLLACFVCGFGLVWLVWVWFGLLGFGLLWFGLAWFVFVFVCLLDVFCFVFLFGWFLNDPERADCHRM